MSVVKLWFLICVCSLLHKHCICGFVFQNNCLKVSSPEYLKGSYECEFSDYGVPQHRGTLTGIVVYPKANQKACHSFDRELSFVTKVPGSLPVFLLVERRDCYLMAKAWNAQYGGASGILVVNDSGESLTKMELLVKESVDAYYKPKITIPTALISLSLANSIKKALKNDDFVRVNLEWTEEGYPHINEPVNFEFDEKMKWQVHVNTERDVESNVVIELKNRWVALVMHKLQIWLTYMFKYLMLAL